MTPTVLRKTASEFWARLRNSPVGVSFTERCREALLTRIIEFPERSSEVIQTIAVPYGGKGGWLSLWRVGGGLKAILWIPPLLYRDPGVRADVEEIQRLLSSVQHLDEVQRRVLDEPKIRAWLAAKGWPIELATCA